MDKNEHPIVTGQGDYEQGYTPECDLRDVSLGAIVALPLALILIGAVGVWWLPSDSPALIWCAISFGLGAFIGRALAEKRGI